MQKAKNTPYFEQVGWEHVERDTDSFPKRPIISDAAILGFPMNTV